MATILVVDDEAPIRQVLRRFLRSQRHTVLEAEDGVAALEVLADRPADIAFVDLMMPRMDGIELIGRLRETHQNVKIVVISAFEEIMDIAERENDVVTSLRKPFEIADLAEALERALARIECT